jgi:hypothetical protein
MFKALAHLLLITSQRGEGQTEDHESGELRCDYASVS